MPIKKVEKSTNTYDNLAVLNKHITFTNQLLAF
jgi:hypothetical protein